MCARYHLRFGPGDLKAMLELFGVELAAPLPERFNIAPGQLCPVVRQVEGRRQLASLHWGLTPRWAKAPSVGSRPINARAETLSTKPSFRESFKQRRCLVPATGFYEWTRSAGHRGKQARVFVLPEQPLFAFAGLWDAWEAEGRLFESFAIVTTEPNQLVASVHDRMPAIVDPVAAQRWLDPRSSTESLQALLRPFPAESMAQYSVGPYVNSPAHEGPRCDERVEDRQLRLEL